MEIVFPCGAKGGPEYCPDLCPYGKFCKIKEKKPEMPIEEEEGTIEEISEERQDVEFYY